MLMRVVGIGVAFTAATLAHMANANEDAAKGGYTVEIVRDEFGVPHIYGARDADVAYGLAYAFSEDDFATLQILLASARGQAGLILGRQGAVIDYGRELMGVTATVERDYAEMPADVRAMLEGYAAGVNRYAATHAKEVRSAKLFPTAGRDIAAGFALLSPQFYGLSDTFAKLYSGQLPEPAKIPGASEPSDKGSNGFAVAPRRMTDGKTWLIANPHLPYEGANALREAVVHSDEGLDFAGATLLGSPFMLVGHNRNLGWTITLNNPDLVDVYKLTLNAKGDQYMLDGKWLPLIKQPVKLPVKAGIISVTARRFVYRSMHGPVIINKQGAFAVRYAGMDNLRMAEQYYRLTKAQDWTQWQKAMEIGGIPSTNYVYADKAGRIAYVYNALFPDRKPGFDYSGILPGDTSANLWTGALPFARIPKIVDPASGFVFSANNSPFHAAGTSSDLKSGDFSPLMGIETRMTNRAWRAEELMSGAASFTPETLRAIKFDTRYSRKSYVGAWIDQLLQVDTSDKPDLAEAQVLMKTWDWNSDGVGGADALAEALIFTARAANMDGKPMPDPKPLLAGYVDWFKRNFGRIDPPLDSLFRLRRGEQNLPTGGGTDTLRTATLQLSQNADRKTIKVSVGGGDSFTMLVNWDAKGKVTSESIVPYGTSSHPDSVHYSDQMQLFVDRRFKPVHFEWKDAVAHGGKLYRP